jgi:hypothetical protein
MPPAIIIAAAIAGSYASAAIGGLAIGGALFGAGILGSIGAAVAFDVALGAVIGGLVSFGINSIGGSLVGGKGGKTDSIALETNSGLKGVIRSSDDTGKIIYGKARIGGTLAYVETTNSAQDSDGISQSGDNLFLHLIIIHACHECNSFEEIYIDNNLITLDASGFVNEAPFVKDSKKYIRLKQHLGNDTQVADSFLVSEVSNWTDNHRLRGLCYTYMRIQYNSEIFQSGVPTLNVVLKGKKVYDPRTLLTGWSDNAALCQRDYLYSRDISNVPFGFGALATEIDDNYTIAAANLCDESITKLDASTMKRYTINGIVDTNREVINTIDDLFSASLGIMTNSEGKFRIYAGGYDTPESAVLDESYLAGAIKSQNRVSRTNLFNAVKGLYIEPSQDWQSASFNEVVSSTYEAQDNNERIYTEIKLPYTIDNEAAQRIAKTVLRKSREQITVVMPCNYKALRYSVWDTVKVNNTARGWSEKVFRITGITFELKQGVVLTLKEENSNSYNWSASDAEAFASAPDTNLPNPFIVPVPQSLSYSSRIVTTTGSDSIYNLVLNWRPSSNAFVQSGGQYEIQFKISSDTAWRPSFFVDGEITSSDVLSTAININYDLRIRAINVIGSKSNWSYIYNAIATASSGVGTSYDYELITSAPTANLDYGLITDTPPAVNLDYGSI